MFLLLEHLPKLIIASIIGGLLGLERSRKDDGSRNSSVGFGTLSILTVGTTLLTILSAYGLGDSSDPSRLIANIITAIGFLCGGVIFTKQTDDYTDNQEVVGLTTGATIFCLSAIGIAIGLEYYALALTTAIIVEINILISRRLKKKRRKNDDIE